MAEPEADAERLSGREFWPAARRIIEDFPTAAAALAARKADEKQLSGLHRHVDMFVQSRRIRGLAQLYGQASALRAFFGSEENAEELLEILAYPKPTQKQKPDTRHPVIGA